MSNFSLSPLFRRSIGFDRFNDLLIMQCKVRHRTIRITTLKTGDNNYRIVVSAAGFNEDQLEINLENQVLTISGKAVEENSDTTVEFLHKGIAHRSFKLSLRLDEHVEVQQAEFENGLLKIELQRNVPEEKLPRQIPIGKNC